MDLLSLVGKKVNHLTIVGLSKSTNNVKTSTLQCQCDCGSLCEKIVYNLIHGKSKICSKKCPIKASCVNLVGVKFGRLLVESLIGVNKSRNMIWRCLCDCGNRHNVKTSLLNNGKVKSCGCLRSDSAKLRCGENHYRWDNNIDHSDCDKRHTSNWRSNVFRRDNYTCQI